MSLHLIESTKRVSVGNRKRGGTAVSILVHAILVLGVFSVAKAATTPDESTEAKTLIYVAPPPTPTIKTTMDAGATPSGNAARAPEFTMPAIDVPPIAIAINVDPPQLNIAPMDLSTRDFRPHRGGGSGSGTENGGTLSEMNSGGVLRDLQVDKQVVALSGYRTPRYREAMRSLGVEATITVQFVVDTLGRIESNSLEFRETAHPQFFPAVRDALANARFRPAEANGRRVRQLVMQSFVFSLARD